MYFCYFYKKIITGLLLNSRYFSRTPDRDFRCFTHVRYPHYDPWRHEMLKWRHHVASQRFQDFLVSFFMFFRYKMRYSVVSKKKNPLFVWGCGSRNPSLVITVCHHSASLVMSMGDPEVMRQVPNTQKQPLNAYAGLGCNFGPSLHLHLYIVYASCVESCGVFASSLRQCDNNMYQNTMCLLNFLVGETKLWSLFKLISFSSWSTCMRFCNQLELSAWIAI